MIKPMNRAVAVAATVFAFLSSGSALASNGLNMIGYGVESVTMGGADVAVARDTSALNTNPAGLTQLSGGLLESNSAMALALDVRHRDRLGNDEPVANSPVVWGEFGYAQRLRRLPVSLGAGLFAQGGGGNAFRRMLTPYAGQDEFSSLFRIVKLDVGGALKVNPAVSVGASVGVLYADLNQKVFPDTSFSNASAPGASFYGYELHGPRAVKFGYKLGVMIKPEDWLTIGLAYTSKVDLAMSGGRYVSNLTAAGLGRVTYRDVHVTGFNLPQEVGLGAAARVGPDLLVSMEVKWINWSAALKTTTLRAADPDNPSAPAVQTLTSPMDWRDQVVVATGIAYQWTDRIILRAGYNYGQNPIPEHALNPLLAAISRQSVTAGAGYRLTERWRVDGGVEYALRTVVRYTNPTLPFGPDAQEVSEILTVHMRVGYLL